MKHNSGRREEERRMKGETSEPEKPHESTRGREAPHYCDGAGARAARYRRAPEPVSRGGCTALRQAHGQALTPRTRRCNSGYALLRVLREHHRVVLRIHYPVTQRQVWLVVQARVLNPERRAI